MNLAPCLEPKTSNVKGECIMPWSHSGWYCLHLAAFCVTPLSPKTVRLVLLNFVYCGIPCFLWQLTEISKISNHHRQYQVSSLIPLITAVFYHFCGCYAAFPTNSVWFCVSCRVIYLRNITVFSLCVKVSFSLSNFGHYLLPDAESLLWQTCSWRFGSWLHRKYNIVPVYFLPFVTVGNSVYSMIGALVLKRSPLLSY